MKEKLSFEQALKRLEEIVNKLETEEVPLEESLSLFEEGMELVDFCEKKLEEVKYKVEVVIRTKTGHIVEQFDEKSLEKLKKLNELNETEEEDEFGELF